jgi:hypothetical protein
MRRQPLVSAALLLLVLAASSTAEAGESAIHPKNRPTPVEGESNGKMRNESLVTVEPGCRTGRSAAPSLARLLAAARADGVALVGDDCYRPYNNQAGARSGACSGGNCACAAPAGGSMHGWGKAVDFDDAAGSLRFTSKGYHWLKAHGARYGWNHPGWAEPGGGPCPEAWHWEWVGDGGNMGHDPIRADGAALLATSTGGGYWAVDALGGVAPRGDARSLGSAAGMPLTHLVVGAAATRSASGYWLCAADGGIFTFGDAAFFGSMGGRRLNRPIVAMAPTATGRGYWLVASDGGIFNFGDAGFFGSMGGRRLNRPIVAMAATPTGLGYWLVASDGGVFAFGDAVFFGGTGHMRLNQPIAAMAPTTTGQGYWLVATDGGVFTFGDAAYFGSLGDRPPNLPVVSMAPTTEGRGYWLLGADGGVFSLGDARFHGAG